MSGLSVAVVGVGAVGTALACSVLAAGRASSVVLCHRRPVSAVSVGGRGFEVEGLVAPEAVAGPVDWVWLAVKAHQTVGAGVWLERLCGPRTRVAVFQNGVEQVERVAAWVPAARVVPVVVSAPLVLVGEGCVTMRGAARVTVPEGEAGRALVALFDGVWVAGACAEDWRVVAWRKLCLNAASGAITALTGRTMAVFEDSEVRALAVGLVRETFDVARALGVVLDDGLPAQLMAEMMAEPGDKGTSMMRDRLAGKPMEIDARNGAVVRLGRRAGVETPLNRAMVALLGAVDGR